jgi:uncharacterized protein involved in outer membrane biogenesis
MLGCADNRRAMTSQDAGRWDRLRARLTRVPVLVTLGVLALVFVVYTLAGFFLVPRLIVTYVPRYAQEQLGRRAAIGEVRVNPLLFKVDVRQFRLTEADGRPLLGFDRLFVDFELSSVFRAAWTFAEIRLESPRVDAVLGADGRINIADLLEALPKGEPAATPAAPPRVLLQHAVVSDGVVSFTDRSQRVPQTAALQPINIELHDVTTLRERRGPYTISATLTGGGVVSWDGHVSLVPLASAGRVDLRGFPLATAWRFVQDDVAIAEPRGQLDANLRYQFTYRDGATSLKVEGMEVGLAGLVLHERDGKTPLLALDRLDVVAAWGDLIARELTVPEIAVSRGRVAATLARDGTVNWQKLVTAAPAPPVPVGPPAPSAETARPWRLAVEKLRVDDVALSLVDESRASPLALDVGGLSLGLSARLESSPAGVAGVADNVGVTLTRVAVRDGVAAKTPLLALDRIALENGRVDLGARHAALARVAVSGGATTVVRDANGELPMLAVLRPAEPPKAARPTLAARPPAPAKPWTVALEKLELGDHRVSITDRGVTPAVELGLADLKASVRGVRTDGKKPWPFDASFRVVQGGRFTARGSVAPDGRAVDATLTLAQLALAPAQPYVTKTAAVVLRAGDVSTAGRLTYRAGSERAAVTYTGAADIDRVAVVEAANNEPLLSWKSLHAETVRFGLGPDRLEIDEVRLTELDGRLVIFQDKSLNLSRLMKPGASPPPAVPAPSALPATAAGREPEPAFPVSVRRVRLDESAMNFADLSLVLPFATRVHALNGVIAGLGSAADSRAAVKLEGRVDEFGSMKVDGALSAFQPKVFTDLAVIFRNVPMSSLSPYSATFAGRRIEGGTLSLDLEYKIDRSMLMGENKVVLTKLQLGERVESPGAMRLPLDLAIAILSDADGRIDLALPVRGNVDHPEFSYGHLIWQALVTVITKVATAPFRALGSLFGGDGEKLEAVAFEPGRDVLLPPEREKLKRVGEVLGKRPRLKLTVHGSYDAKLDGEALRALHVRENLAQRLGVKLRPGEDPGPVALDDVKTQRALEAALSERGGGKAVDEFVAAYEKASGKKPDRANAVLALVGRGAGDRALYDALYRRLVETEPMAEAELTTLAKRRGEATVRALTEGSGAAAARAAVGDPEAAGRAERSGIPTRLELGAVGS